jgi:hypothetical protein
VNQQEITAYLAASPMAVVATIHRNGAPHLTPNWYGTATRNDQDIWDEARRIIERNRAPDQVDDYLARWKTEPRVLITVTPERIATRAPRRR